MVPIHLKCLVWISLLVSDNLVASSTSTPPQDEAVFADSYHYIIVGGGTSGLVVANRLSEDPTKKVLVIEHGVIDNSSLSHIPRLGIENYPNNVKDWGYMSKPVKALANTTWPVNMADVVGGGSLKNAMFADRGSKADYDAWGTLVDDDAWSWDGLYPYFIKSSTFTPPSDELAKEFDIKNDQSAYGNGPVQISYPSIIYGDLRNQTLAANAYGIETSDAPESGDAVGFCWTPQTLDPATGFRSHSRSAYYDPVASRPNLQLVTAYMVEKIIFDDNLKATGVQIRSLANNKTSIVSASQEVILAAGAINTPKLLQLSGIGARKVLEDAGVEVLIDLAAVGANFQDHPATFFNWNLSNLAFPNDGTLYTDSSFNASAWQEYVTKHTGPYTRAQSPSAAFLPLSQISSNSSEIIGKARSQDLSEHLPSLYEDKALHVGYLAQREILLDHYNRNDAAVIEIIIGTTGPGACAIAKPLSRGTVTLDPKNPHAQPIISYNTLSAAADGLLISNCMRFVRGYYASPLLTDYKPIDPYPGQEAQSDEQILAALISNQALTPSLHHPAGTCALGTKENGGCVGCDLRVWGTEGLSVVDASVMPLIPAAHLQLTVYAVAEKAADLIKARG